ncbi:MAG: tetratricopeptide repeat protein [Bacteroidales bacterium]|jgi:tetratricopeptide (TPR) repeat protein|nr:tetratricopeptide repeat protein [Bacteroidales bacterium]
MKRIFSIICLFSFVVISVWAQTEDTLQLKANGKTPDYRKEMRAGNKLYEAGQSVDAETAYRKALIADEKSHQAAFNLGDALYRQQKYDEAGKQFEIAAAEMTDKKDKSRAYHNLGNSLLQQQKLKESIDAYKQALRNDPKDMDTKYNLSYAMNLLKQQEQQNQDDQKDQNQDKDKQDQNKDQQDQQKDQQDQDKDEQDQQDQKNQDQQKDQQQQDQQKNEQGQKEQQISPEDAQRMLDAIAQEEKELQEKLQKKERAGHRGKIEKNW